MTLVWVTGNSGVGKSTVSGLLEERGELAVDADWEGYSHWVDRRTGRVVTDPPFPVPPGWLHRYGWQIDRDRVEALATRAGDRPAFLCGSAENEADVRDLFDVIVCLVIDTATMRQRLAGRATNPFGAHPEELAAAVDENLRSAALYRRLGATIIDAGAPPAEVADAVLKAAR